MANDKKNIKEKKPKFSPYWIYGIVIAIFIGTSVFSNSGFQDGKATNPTQFFHFMPNFNVIFKSIIDDVALSKKISRHQWFIAEDLCASYFWIRSTLKNNFE